MNYVYGCADNTHPRWEINHSMRRNPTVICPVCHRAMKRIPQTFRFYHNPAGVLFDKLDARYREYRARKR